MKKCGIIINTYNSDAAPLAQTIKMYLEERSVSVCLYEFSALNTDTSLSNLDFVITLGGDGTVLFAARCCSSAGIPVFPINLGQFGFIAGINRSEWEQELEKFLDGKLPIAKRSMVHVSLIRRSAGEGVSHESVVFSASALNEVVISGKNSVRIVSLEIACSPSGDSESVSFGKFRSDGVIVATATGSTAYCAAAGGPIVDPSLDVFVLNPVCPFSLSNRPVVLPAEMVMSVTVLPSRGAGVILSVDGQVTVDVQDGDRIIIQRSDDKALLVGCDSKSFYTALRSKLNWSGSAN